MSASPDCRHRANRRSNAASAAKVGAGARAVGGDRIGPMTQGTLDDRLAALVGLPISDSGPSHGPDAVNAPMIRHWAAAFEDWNPVYTDPEAAKASRFGEIVAPPLMLQTLIIAKPRIT